MRKVMGNFLMGLRSKVGLLQIASAVALLGCLLLLGCQQPESIFKLAPESRLPRWFVLPPGISRSDISITMSYYVTSSGRSAKFTMSDAQSHKLSEMSGELKGLNLVSLKNPTSESSSEYPSYEIVTVGGITEVVEHRRMEPIFYITDDSSVLKNLGVDK